MDEEIKILCVDDEQNVLNALKRLFLDDDYAILTATAGKEGLEILEKEHAQIVISDYRMPAMNGVEFLKAVCNRWPYTVRIVFSGYADAASIVSTINEGQIYKFISKPWNDDELKVTVSNAIERYYLFKKNRELTTELQKKNEELTRLNLELKKLLEEKSINLEFSCKALTAHQNILDSIPEGIIGIDFENAVAQSNLTWNNVTGNTRCPLGERIEEYFPQNLIQFNYMLHKI